MQLMRRVSVRWRLTIVAAGVFAAALTGASFVLVRSVHNNLVASIRATDRQELAQLASQLRNGTPEDQLRFSGMPERGFPQFFLIVGADGQIKGALIPGQEGFRRHEPRNWNGGGLQTRQTVNSPAGRITLVAQRSLAEVDDTTGNITDGLLIGVPILVLLVGALAWYLAGRALRPVELIRAEAAAITGSTMHRRVPEPETHDEVGRLARTMNAMLERLERSSERQRQFVSDASHELRSPVTVIRAQLEVALRRGDEVDWPAVAERVLAEDERLEQTITELLELARVDENNDHSDFVEVDLDEVVLEEVSRVRGVGVDVSRVSAGRVLGKAQQLARVVHNLLDNARRHADRAVAVSLEEHDDVVELHVDDDGPGIAPDDRERVFERFTRLDEGRARDAGGMGLGLALVKATVERHEGTVHIEDSPLGGARFVVKLPAALAPDDRVGTDADLDADPVADDAADGGGDGTGTAPEAG
ncbi:MAG TPA: ATP-binding protein [Acidimicrobiia bacterium]|nr:ATP-binding protein [Acidimicrobiia bacterium]